MKNLFVRCFLIYLRFFARLQLAKNRQAVIIGITGSAGKTSTRLALSRLLSAHGAVKQSFKANSESGIPLNILGLSPHDYSLLDWLRLALLAPIKLLTNWERFHYFVVEMGVDSPTPPKNMGYLLTILRPDLAVMLNAGLVHGEAFDHLIKDRSPRRRQTKIQALIAAEKMRLAQAVSATGTVILNWDQPEFRVLSRTLSSRVIKFGRRRGARLLLSPPRYLAHGTRFGFSYQGRSHTLVLPDYYEPAYAYTFAAATAAAAALGIPLARSLSTLEGYRSPPGRMRIFSGLRGSTILDSSYNASPATMQSALSLLNTVAKTHPRWAVLGDMRELGKGSKLAHKDLADWIRASCDEVLLFGAATRAYTLPVLLSAHFPARHFRAMPELIKYMVAHLPDKAYILIKGSQNTLFLERAVEAILADSVDLSRLCRRGKYWNKLRASAL